MASNFVGFFEKLANILERISAAFPQYSEILTYWKLNRNVSQSLVPARLKASLGQVYADLLGFFRSVIRIFTRKDGSKLLQSGFIREDS